MALPKVYFVGSYTESHDSDVRDGHRRHVRKLPVEVKYKTHNPGRRAFSPQAYYVVRELVWVLRSSIFLKPLWHTASSAQRGWRVSSSKLQPIAYRTVTMRSCVPIPKRSFLLAVAGMNRHAMNDAP